MALPERGIEVEVERHGEVGGRPFVLVHGFSGSRDDWAEHLEPLAELGPTLAYDQRGHGGSTNLGDPAAYSLAHLVDDAAALLDRLGIEACDLLGHSMGGAMAMRFALAHPERVRSLVLMDTMATPLGLAPEPILEKMAAIRRDAGGKVLCDAMRRRAEEDPLRPPAMRACEARMGPDRFWARIEAKLEAMDPEAMLGFGRQLVRAESVQDRLGEIRCPTLVLVGEQDAPFREPSERMAEALPDATLEVVPDAAHSPQLESPEAWGRAIRTHLARARA